MFYEKFIDLCAKSGESPTSVVLNIGLTSASLSKWGTGSTPRPATIAKICNYFGLPHDYFTNSAEKENPDTPKSTGIDADLMRLWDKMTDEEKQSFLKEGLAILGKRLL